MHVFFDGNFNDRRISRFQFGKDVMGFFKMCIRDSSNPVPIKAALALMGDIQPGVRLPLVPLPEEKEAQLSNPHCISYFMININVSTT